MNLAPARLLFRGFNEYIIPAARNTGIFFVSKLALPDEALESGRRSSGKLFFLGKRPILDNLLKGARP